jgi:hypothetical protein
MEPSPCLSCAGRDQNKNNRICRDCNKRIDYVNRLERNLNFAASYSDNRSATRQVSFFSRNLKQLLHHGEDAIY